MWGVPILILICAAGVFYTIVLGGIQFTKLGYLFNNTVGKLFRKVKPSLEAKGDITSFQAAMTSVSAIVGSGNIAGVTTALVCGGPGALFWMIIAALIGMATKFAEVVLGVKYREEMADGSFEGGAVGSVFVCMRYGIARGMYSNEAGLGTAAMIHCGAKVDHPVEQGMWGLLKFS